MADGLAPAVAAVEANTNVRAEVTEDVTTVTWSSPLDAVKVDFASTAVAVLIVVKNVEAGGKESVTAVRATWLYVAVSVDVNMPFIDLAPPSWEAVLDDVPTTLYAPEVVAAGTVATLVDALGAVGDEVWIVL